MLPAGEIARTLETQFRLHGCDEAVEISAKDVALARFPCRRDVSWIGFEVDLQKGFINATLFYDQLL